MPNIDKVIAHRGASLYAPENTLASFAKADALGATWVETDVMLTLDNVPVLHHDETFERTANTLAYVNDTPYSFVKTLDAGSWFAPAFKDEKIPTLKKALAFLLAHDMSLNLEIKPTTGRDEDTARIAMQTVMEAGFPKENLLVTSFSLPALKTAQQVAPNYHYGWIAEDQEAVNEGLKSGLSFFSIGMDQKNITAESVHDLKNKGYAVLSYTVNDRERAEVLFSMGVDAVFSDNPSLLLTPAPRSAASP